MAIQVTVEDVRNRCNDLKATDVSIQDLITIMGCLLDECLEGSYPNCAEQAKTIKILTICHFALSGTVDGQVTNRRWPNGASEAYSVWASGQGLQATRFGTMILSLDTAQCIRTAFPDSQRRFVGSIGTSGSRDSGYTIADRQNKG